jgi:rfaE bifunctional protein nucleotidyltransferase chain/domain
MFSSLPEYYQQKIIHPSLLVETIVKLRKSGEKIITLNGSFDLIHSGHLHILFEAAQQGGKLFVALNSDSSIQKYKSIDRPITPLVHRVALLAALECVNYVTWFDETDPRELLKVIKPDVHVNGAEYGGECIEASTVREGGGKLHLVNRIPGLATSEIIQKIKRL